MVAGQQDTPTTPAAAAAASSGASSAFNAALASPITAATHETLAQNSIVRSVVPTPPFPTVSGGQNGHAAAAAAAALSSSAAPPADDQVVIQAAGHGLLRLDPERDGAIVKPTTRQECVTYECMMHDARMRRFAERFVPRYFASWPMRFVVPGSKFTHEVSLVNLCRLGVDEPQVLHWRGALSFAPSVDGRLRWKSVGVATPPSSDGNAAAASPSAAVVLYQSPPCVLDLKIGRYRYTQSTPLRKYMRQMRKDSLTTARSVGMRICGVKHCRGVMDSFLTADQLRMLSLLSPSPSPVTESASAAAAGAADTSKDGLQALLEERRRLRRANMKKRNEKALKKRDESDSEIMQLPKAMEQLEERQRSMSSCFGNSRQASAANLMDSRLNSDFNNVPSASNGGEWGEKAVVEDEAEEQEQQSPQQPPIEPELLQWSEDKIFGRNCDADELLEALAMFCTLLVDVDDNIGREALCKEDKSASLRFDPFPEQALLDFYRRRVGEMLAVMGEDDVLARYSFASSSILLVHRWRIVRQRRSKVSSSDASAVDSLFLEIDADMRLVDFSSSGPIDMSLAPLGTKFNSALQEGDERARERERARKQPQSAPAAPLLPHPTAAPNQVLAKVPESGVMPLFADEVVEFSFGLKNLQTALGQLCEACTACSRC